jgi:hypothetical protein
MANYRAPRALPGKGSNAGEGAAGLSKDSAKKSAKKFASWSREAGAFLGTVLALAFHPIKNRMDHAVVPQLGRRRRTFRGLFLNKLGERLSNEHAKTHSAHIDLNSLPAGFRPGQS